MNARLIKTLLFMALFLGVIIIAESSYAKYSNLKLKQEFKEIVAGNIEAEVLPSFNLKEIPIETYTDLINRPLFTNTRRVIKEVIVIPKAIIKPIVKTTIFKHELIGIFGNDVKINALFRNKSPRNAKNKNQRFYMVKVGENIEGWFIKKINKNTVVIENNGKIETIEWSTSKPRLFKTLRRSIKKKVLIKKKIVTKNKINNQNNPFKIKANR